MTKDEALAGAAVIGAVAGLSWAMPGVRDMWKADPDDEEAAVQLRTGFVFVLGAALVLGTFYAIAHRSVLPVVVAAGAALAVGYHFEQARATSPEE